MDISIVVPAYNEAESIPELTAWIDRILREAGLSFEVLIIDDGSNDGTWEAICEAGKQIPSVKGIRFMRNYGKSAALEVGFEAAIGDVVITMDADLQDSPEEIPALRAMIMEEGFDLVSGWKRKRYDPITKTIPTKLFNWATRSMSGIRLHDFNCGLKAYRLDVVKAIEVYGEMHRYIPVIAKRAGFRRIGEKEVQHRARKFGTTKFGMERFVNGFLDLLSISFVTKFGRRPMHLFGLVGTLVFVFGFLAAAYIGAEKFYYLQMEIKARLVTDNPWFYMGLTSMIIGTQLFLACFLGEMVARNNPDRNHYLIKEKVNF
jgi:glycosyltransferase involved in cell wall biosynthesis